MTTITHTGALGPATVQRLGYGAMQLAGHQGDAHVFGPPQDRAPR